MVPLILKLKKQMHKDIALAQDLVVKEVYKIFDNAIIHGGTAIWRCYHGNRFSEDVDVYIQKDIKKIDAFFENLKKSGFEIEKKKVSENSIFSSLRLNRTNVQFEALFKKVSGVLKEYETCEGNKITIYTLSSEDFIKEKIETYLKRFKVRDLYDVFFLLRYVSDRKMIRRELKKLSEKFKKPVDEEELKVLIIEGLVPKVEKMMEYIKNY